ncbi:MAG: N-methyl-L-tryptophan oxidase [Acidobacteria bacterium]|nr:MAG: N-methyl-L-tryptophan oxidase [Acidobacteriota bacterium]
MVTRRDAFDAVVLGGGVIGAAAARALLARRRRVALVEQYAAGHERGSSHGDGRIIRYSYAEPIYVEMARRAYAAWSALAAAAGTRLVDRTGGLDCGPRDSPQLAELAATLGRLEVPFERLDAAGVRRRFPQLRLPAGAEALYQADGGVVRAARAVAALWRLVEAEGGRILGGFRARRIAVEDDGITVYAADGRAARAPRLVLAAGAWSGALLAPLGLDLPLVATEEQVAYFAPRPGAASHAVGELPTVIDYHGGDAPFYALPQIEVPGVKVGQHRTGEPIDADGPRRLRPELRRRLCDYVARSWPQLEPAPLVETTCLYTNTPDHDFVVDHHPQDERLVIGAGFSGHGFKFAPVIGEMLAALALGEPDPLPRRRFAIARFAAGRRTGSTGT